MGNVAVRQRGETFSGFSELVTMCCSECAVLYAIPERLRSYAERTGNFEHMWCCPNGHTQGYGDNPLEKAERNLKFARDRAARLAAERDQAQATAKAQKGRATRFKNDRDRDRKRVAAGVCPCCNRTFQNLSRHMAGQHPEFATPTED